MRRTFTLALLLLIGCTPSAAPVIEPNAEPTAQIDPPAVAEKPLEQLPSEFSIPYFSQMRLSGTGLTLESIEAQNDVYTRYRISYRSNGLKITGIMNIPNGPGPYPFLIFNHGYIAPSVYTQGRGLKREQDYMARNGFAVLHTDYRGHAGSDESPMTEKVYDGALEYAMDSINAIHAVRAAKLPQIDATNVGMLGHSLGGGVTLAILTAHPSMVNAAVLYAPVHSDVWENFQRWRAEREEGDRTIEAFGTAEENPEFWKALSPGTYLSSIQAPILLFHGDRDRDVPKEWSDTLQERLTKLQKDITYVEYAGEGHEFGPRWGDFMQKSAPFFKEQLSN